MSYRITDLLDDYMDSSVHLFPPEEVLSSSPADPDGVPNTPTPPQSRHRMKKPLVIAAALLLAVTGIAAGCLTLSRFPNGASLNTGLSELPESTPWNSPDSGQSVVESIPEDIVLDDTNSVIVTSGATGLSIRVPTEFQDELKTDNSFTLTTIYSDDESFDFDSIFTFCDSSNQDNSNGIVFSIYAWNQSAFDSYMNDETRGLTYELNSVVLGTDAAVYYSMLQFGNSISTRFPHFDNATPDSAKSYYAHLQYVIPMVNSFIALNGLDSVNTGLDSWDELFRQRMLEPLEELIEQLEPRSESEQPDPSPKELSLPAGEDTDGDGLLTAQLDIPIETEYGTAMLQKFTLELSSGQFRWYVDCSQLSGPFEEDHASMNDILERSEFESASLAVLNTVQEAISDNHLVYPDGSQLFVPTGELVDYYDHIHECYDTLGVATAQPTCDQNPSCLEIGGVTYGFD